ncbi:hypothetical protein [Sphingomonas sp. UYP23]
MRAAEGRAFDDFGNQLQGEHPLGAAEERQPSAPRLRFGLQVSLYGDVLD